MPGYIKVWVKMFIDFIFSISIITGIGAYSLLGTITSENLKVIIAETSSDILQSDVILSGSIPEYLIRNFLWYSVFIFVFCLIILYFMEPKLKVFLFPGSLCFLSVFFVQAALMIMNSFIVPGSDAAASEVISLFFKKANQASLALGLVGMILLIASTFNIYQAKLKNNE